MTAKKARICCTFGAAGLIFYASQLYARNIQALLTYLIHDGKLTLDADDEIARGATIVRSGEIVHEPTKAALTGGAA